MLKPLEVLVLVVGGAPRGNRQSLGILKMPVEPAKHIPGLHGARRAISRLFDQLSLGWFLP